MEHLKTKMEPDQCHVRVTVCGILQNTAVSQSVSPLYNKCVPWQCFHGQLVTTLHILAVKPTIQMYNHLHK